MCSVLGGRGLCRAVVFYATDKCCEGYAGIMDSLSNVKGGAGAAAWENLLVVVLIFIAVGAALFIVRRVVIGVVERWARTTENELDDIALDVLRHPSIFWVVAIALYVAFATSDFSPKYVAYGLKALNAVIIFSVTMAMAGLGTSLIRYYVDKSDANIPATGILKSVVKVMVYTVGLLIILNSLGISIIPILTALGVGGLAVALALQDTLSNLFAGMHLLMERTLKAGDYVKIGDGEEGYVEDIGWRTTKIRKLQNNIVIIPNNKLAQSVITNYHLPEKKMLASMNVSVSYEADPQKVEAILLDEVSKAVLEISGMVSDPKPAVLLQGLGDFSMNFLVVFHVAEYSNQNPALHELRKRVLGRFKKEGITIPFPVSTVH